MRRILTRTGRCSASHPKELSETIEKHVQPLNIKTVIKTKATLRQQLMKVKGKPDKYDVKGVVYSIPCKCGLHRRDKMHPQDKTTAET